MSYHEWCFDITLHHNNPFIRHVATFSCPETFSHEDRDDDLPYYMIEHPSELSLVQHLALQGRLDLCSYYHYHEDRDDPWCEGCDEKLDEKTLLKILALHNPEVNWYWDT